jgi:hypothetical protein
MRYEEKLRLAKSERLAKGGRRVAEPKNVPVGVFIT